MQANSLREASNERVLEFPQISQSALATIRDKCPRFLPVQLCTVTFWGLEAFALRRKEGRGNVVA